MLQLRRFPQDQVVAVLERVAAGEVVMTLSTSMTGDETALLGIFHDRSSHASVEFLHQVLQPAGEASLKSALDEMPATPADKLAALFQGLSRSSVTSPVLPSVREWAMAGIRSAVQSGDSLDETLGFKGAGKRSLAATLDTQNRDRSLLAALQHVAVPDAGVSDWERCLRLAKLIKSFSKIDWPKVCRDAAPAPGWPQWKKCLFAAAQSAHGSSPKDCKLPSSATRLYQIVQANTGYSLKGGAATVLASYRKSANTCPLQKSPSSLKSAA
ncbi:hypothetical protein [Polaromonas naphthalenivorans]|nr:hypothetical protein [Polaromonas naphthalenivorans]